MSVKTIIKILFLSLPLVFSSCKKEGCMDVTAINYDAKAKIHNSAMCTYKPTDPTYTTGNLVVNARDVQGTSIIGEYVYLYNNQADFNNRLYSKKLITNNSGQVKFENLSPAVYYMDCDFQNSLGGTTTIKGSGSVSAGYETTITIKP